MFAHDSTWLLCQSDSLVVSAHEHRSGGGGDGRATSFNLIFGVHDLRGELKDKDSGRVKLKGVGEAETNFVGTISVDYQTNKLSVAGTLKLDGEPTEIETIMPCKEMSTEL